MNKKEAAARLDVSTRLIEKYAGEGKLGEVKYVRGRTGRQADYDEQAVEKLKAELEAPAFALVPAGAAAQSREAGLVAPQDRERFINALEAIASHEQTRAGLVVAAGLGEKIMLTLADAAALSSLSTGHLRDALRAGQLKGKIIGRGYKIKRADLDHYVKKL
jgi:excisionase family DNA binding protein